MTRLGPDRTPWVVAGLLAIGTLLPLPASAQQWHELYSSGVAALRSGQGDRAAELLRRAIEKRPRPGVRVPTYGTNFEPQYFPYLRLAEAYLLLDAVEEAAEALETSARLGIEPPEERAALEARVRARLEARRPARPSEPTPPPTPPPHPWSLSRPRPRETARGRLGGTPRQRGSRSNRLRSPPTPRGRRSSSTTSWSATRIPRRVG